MKQLVIVALLTLLAIGYGCVDASSSDSSSNSDSDSDSDGDSDDEGDNEDEDEGDDGSEEDDNVDEDIGDVPSGQATMVFCNQVNPMAAVLATGDGSTNTTFAASPNCCTACQTVAAGSNIMFELYDGDRKMDTSNTSVVPGTDNVAYATLANGSPAIVLKELDPGSCSTFLPYGMERCAK